MSPQEWDELISAIEKLPPELQAEAVKRMFSNAISVADDGQIVYLMEGIKDQFPLEIPLVREVVEIMEGQLAIREILR